MTLTHGTYEGYAAQAIRAAPHIPMHQIVLGCRVALERGLINCQGKTPEATMASALYTDVKRKHDKSVFTRCGWVGQLLLNCGVAGQDVFSLKPASTWLLATGLRKACLGCGSGSMRASFQRAGSAQLMALAWPLSRSATQPTQR